MLHTTRDATNELVTNHSVGSVLNVEHFEKQISDFIFELLNEMITSVRGFGRCGVTGVYAGYVCGACPMINHFY